MPKRAATGLPGRDADLAWLFAEQAAIAKRGKDTVFIAGDDGSGRTTLLRSLATEAGRAKRSPAVIAGGFRDGRFVPWEKPRAGAEDIMEVVELVVKVTGAIAPYGDLIVEVLSKGKAAVKLVRSYQRRSMRIQPTDLLPTLLRELCTERPVVCVMDDAHEHPSGWWGDLVASFGARIAKDIPLMLVLGTDGPTELGGPEVGQSDMLYASRKLVRDGTAQWRPLERLTAEQLEDWTSPASHTLLQQLLDVTGGRAEWTAELWKHWRDADVITHDARSGSWRFAADGRERAMDPSTTCSVAGSSTS